MKELLKMDSPSDQKRRCRIDTKVPGLNYKQLTKFYKTITHNYVLNLTSHYNNLKFGQ